MTLNAERRRHGHQHHHRTKARKWKRSELTALHHFQDYLDKDDSENEQAQPKENAKEKEPPLQIFRRTANVVRLLCGVCIALRKYAMAAGLMENYMVEVTTRKSRKDGENAELEELTFNLKDFKINRELKVPPQIIDILERPPDWRTQEDIEVVARLMRHLPSFKKYTTEMQHMMCRIVRYMKCGKRRVVLRKGHVGFSVYFIYSGSVSVVLDKDDQSIFVKPEVVILKKGACFGEIALTQNTRRNATIVCAEECEFLIIDKEDYVENGLHLQMQEEFNHRFNFLRNWPPLSKWTDTAINNLSYVSRTEDANHNRVIVKDSRKNEWLWFIVEGSCDVLRLVDLEGSSQYDDYQALFLNSQNHQIMSHHSYADYQRCPHTSAGFRNTRQRCDTSKTEDSTADGKSVDNLKDNHEEKVRRLDQAVQRVLSGDSHDVSHPNDDVANGLFFKVDTLRDGQCFGLDALYSDYIPHRYSMVSKGCVLIHVPRTKFRELADETTIDCIRVLLKSYPSDEELCHRFMEKTKWDHYKHNTVESVVSNVQNNVTFENSLRQCQSQDYSKKSEMNHMTSHFYTPLTSVSHSPLIGSYTISPTNLKETRMPGMRNVFANQRPRTAAPRMRSSSTRTKRQLEISLTSRPYTSPPLSSRYRRNHVPSESETDSGLHTRCSSASRGPERISLQLRNSRASTPSRQKRAEADDHDIQASRGSRLQSAHVLAGGRHRRLSLTHTLQQPIQTC